MQLVKAQPIPANELDIAVEIVMAQHAIDDEPQWQLAQFELANNWLSFNSVASREGFVPVK